MSTLSPSHFLCMVKNTPLVSIDLVITDRTGAILMGWRRNEPASACWFVPGGRIRKDEKISDAFARILDKETGLRNSFYDAHLGGVFEHFYSENCFADPTFGTHYCVLAYVLRVNNRPNIQTDDQHERFAWLTSSDPNIHKYCHAYFALVD